MNITTTVGLSGGIYSVDISTGADVFTPIEQDAVSRFGEPLIECGGTFTLDALNYTLDSLTRYFPSQFPIRQRFSIADNANAYDRATLWKNTILTRIVSAITTLRGNNITQLGTEVHNLSTTP